MVEVRERHIRDGFVQSSLSHTFRSSPRKRGPRATGRGPWIPAFARMNGVCCIVGIRERHLRDGFVQSLAMLVRERGLD